MLQTALSVCVKSYLLSKRDSFFILTEIFSFGQDIAKVRIGKSGRGLQGVCYLSSKISSKSF